MGHLGCLKLWFLFFATVLFFFTSRYPFHCALSASIIGSVSHPAGDRPSHPICETGLSECGLAASFTSNFRGNMIPAMDLGWCCEDFRGRLFHDDGNQDGLGIFVFFRSRVPPLFQLEYRRPNRKPPDAIAEDGIRLKFR